MPSDPVGRLRGRSLFAVAFSLTLLAVPCGSIGLNPSPASSPSSVDRVTLESTRPLAPSSGNPASIATHSNPIPFGAPSYSGPHYYAGTVFNGLNTTASSISVGIAVPQDRPDSSDFYYVLLSVWDDAGSYDQLGFTSGSGVWGLAYSTTTPCAGSYFYQTDAYDLTPGQSYRFQMTAVSGSVDFTATTSSGNLVWATSVHTGLTQFLLQTRYYCGGGSYFDFTDYEEVYTTNAPVPPYPFYFSNNTASSSGESSWAVFTSLAPSSITVGVRGTNVTVENEPFTLSAAPTFGAEYGTGRSTYATNVTVGTFASGPMVNLSSSGTVPNATVTLSRAFGTAPFGFALQVGLTNATRPGSYPVDLLAAWTGGIYARIQVFVVVVPTLRAMPPVSTPPAADVNQSIVLREQPMGGWGLLKPVWSGLPTNCSYSGLQLYCNPTVAGSYLVSVTLTDALGFASTSSVTSLEISPDMRLAGSVSASSIDVGQSVQFSVLVSGGSGGFQFSWAGSSGTTCGAIGGRYTCVAFGVGRLAVSVTVQDSNGARAALTPYDVTILSDPVVTLVARPALLEIGGSVVLNATASGGSGGFGYRFLGTPGACSSLSSISVRCTPALFGVYQVTAEANDSNGFASSSLPVSVTVYPLMRVTASETASSVLAGEGVTFSLNISGGSTRYDVRWSGLPPECSSTNAAELTCTSSTVGYYEVRATVTDSLGGNASTSISFRVEPAFLGLPATEGYAIVLVVGAAAALGAAAVVLRIRRRRGPSVRQRTET